MKNILCVSAIATALFVSCSSSNNSSNELVARQMVDYFNRHEWEKMAALYSDDADFLDPSLGPDYVKQSHEAMIAKYSAMEKMFPDLHDEVVAMCSADDKVVVEFVATGSSGDSIKFKLPIAAILTVRQGKIVRDATYYDNQ